VFQHNQTSLLPWRTNLDNVALPLELSGMRKPERTKKAREFLDWLDVQVPLDCYPYQLSGGQQQLLCIARALIADPDVILMDEPFNQLDFQTRIAMNEKLQDIWSKTGKTTLFVSHDADEALLLADRTFILTKRPAAIARTIENRLPRPRTRTLLQDEAFFQLKKVALSTFEQVIAAS
jgi:NitT/TauT family transport system ATP-binding protein